MERASSRHLRRWGGSGDWFGNSDSSQAVRVVRPWCRRAEAAALVGEMTGWGEVEVMESGGKYSVSGLWVKLGFLSGVVGVAVEDFVRLWLCFWGEIELDMVVNWVWKELGVAGKRLA